MNDLSPIQSAEPDSTPDRSAHDWYKDAVIYQLHVKTFMDANNDGIGDFAGLLSKLDYVKELGVTAIWIMPFYPSPLRDDGYDISDYETINPSYGSMEDFERLVEEAHKRDLKIITELVINHTSDQHPWFQAARNAPKGSPERDFYVWRDDDKGYDQTRIIFLDTESSNWTWDPVAGQYFWHRFYSHQPDLNFDNPRVIEEVLKTMRFWLDKGVDGLRLDAIPYLVEREGTNNENLPETHDVLKVIRAEIDAHYPDRMLLAEANQWPEDTRPYFGEGDECHMAFHFPLMPRMYMALAQEDRHPITDILRQTPDIPDNCQWAIFLRNHDELTLEMVTAEERDYLWSTYANDKRARINLGIRRRLGPLMGGDRRKVELLNALLMSMPGTPVLYYGDEIGMGDNYYLGDRDGVRTPMQWSADRNGGFSRADPQRLYLPPIQDPVYGFQAVNVEAQSANPASPLAWMRRLVQVRGTRQAFGRGTISFLYPSNRKILAYLREHEGDRILCVANLSGSAQAVELDLSAYAGSVPVEMLGLSPFPKVGTTPYNLSMPAYGFYWFALGSEDTVRASTTPEPQPEFQTLVITGDLKETIPGRNRREIENVLPGFVGRQRWFAGRTDRPSGATYAIVGQPSLGSRQHLLGEAVVRTDAGDQRYFLPLAAKWGEEHLHANAPTLPFTLAKIRLGAQVGAVIDAARDASFVHLMVQLMAKGETIELGEQRLRIEGSSARAETLQAAAAVGVDEISPLSGEQSNTSIAVGSAGILKFYRRLRDGDQPELEVTRFLTERTDFTAAPALLASMELERADGTRAAVAALFERIVNQGDAWTRVTESLSRYLRDNAYGTEATAEATDEGSEGEMPLILQFDPGETIGRRTGEMHAALATRTGDPAFDPEPFDAASVAVLVREAQGEAHEVLDILANLPVEGATGEEVRRLVDAREAIDRWFAGFADLSAAGLRTRIHGDYHLGQLLVSLNDIVILDFEGEPGRSLEERRAKTSPLRDVAGMMRSYDYAAFAARDRVGPADEATLERIREMAESWRDATVATFLDAWQAASGVDLSDEGNQRLLDLFLLQKAFYELRYEAAMRPAWLSIPLRGIVSLLQKRQVLS
ncbi:maltose alpha-D-glucosyltransferase [Aureimonas jatrophae]|uniref:maltose alpha-D-glucosyltransferase n=1 Tax=Aureimonas jatrophae TaxID=1166073 RepID=A0A1H0HMA5_9HYPH|nr:maltose alpha-D-glucosyltransferase [Aureimonas jatrophae]MBB3950666.1 maltose alpha-D-glucosyltransferase/alpha-amylase [Aureimonas jatrophae]SDO20250.1 trehalose synthase /maltokinase [Aureimonas jatrophae]